MNAKLVVEEGDLQGVVFSLEEGESWIIGSDSKEAGFILNDPDIPHKHALVQKDFEGNLTLQNISAVDPLFVNDEEIGNTPVILQQGDTIKIGHQLLRFYKEDAIQIVDPLIEPETDDLVDDFLKEEALDPSFTNLEDPLSEDSAPIEIALPNFQEEIETKKNEETFGSSSTPTIFAETEEDVGQLAEINFSFVEGGRWLLKVVGGPNNGAEFYMQTGHSYVIGTDAHTCDVVFHDNSVSRQHARVTVSNEDELTIEDLKSRNGIFVAGLPVDGSQKIEPNTLITVGTTSFLIYDREGEMQTIISPLLPSIVKALQGENQAEENKSNQEGSTTPASPALPIKEEVPSQPKSPHHYGSLILASILLGLFVLASIGTIELFKDKPVTLKIQENAEELIQNVLQPYPAVRGTFNKTSGTLLLIGHVATAADSSQLLYNLENLKFIKSVDYSGLIIDEYVWQEMNSILAKNSNSKGITVHSPAAGQFVLSGYLQTRKQAEALSNYISLNFPYLDLLKKDVIVEEDVLSQINVFLRDYGFVNVTVKMVNGEITLTGDIPSDKTQDVNELIAKIKTIPGVRVVNSYVQSKTADLGAIDLSDQYRVSGRSRVGNHYNVVVNGKILSEGDTIDGMEIKTVTPDTILLEKGGVKYRISY